MSNRSGHREIWTMVIGGGPVRQVTRGESERLYPAWSPDGREIVSHNPDDGLFVSPARGGQERRLTSGDDRLPDWSPDGKWIAFQSTREGGLRRTWRVPASGGQPERLTTVQGQRPRWSSDGRQIYFLGLGPGANNIWALSMATRKERPVTAFSGRRGVLGPVGLAVDARQLPFTWEESRGDIWVADIVQPPGP